LIDLEIVRSFEDVIVDFGGVFEGFEVKQVDVDQVWGKGNRLLS
jgi:hypothetical protein